VQAPAPHPSRRRGNPRRSCHAPPAQVYGSDSNFVVAAPTASGKTGLVELAMCRNLSRYVAPDGGFEHQPGASKTVYVAPMKALVQEKSKAWSERFGKLGVRVLEMTGDSDAATQEIRAADLILTTPEKLDSVTRKHRERGTVGWVGDISLVVMDEVHILGERRGSVLEAVVGRLLMLRASGAMRGLPLSGLRLGAVSATVPNAADVAGWLRCPPDGLRVYGEEMRPVPLQVRVQSFPEDKRGDFMFERSLARHVVGVLEGQYRVGGRWQWKPTLVFCSSRKGCSDTAR